MSSAHRHLSDDLCDLQTRPRHRENRPAKASMPPFRLHVTAMGSDHSNLERSTELKMGLLRLLRGHRHHVAVEIGDDPDRTGDDQKDDQNAEREGQNIVCAVRAAAQMQEENEVNADLR
jgi:hypothetical protein